ncbi:MAG TPA: glycosyltransferase family 4 protein [Bacteroidales bacterium]|nr:glycosyltransferase family 4 protein [Bacteroidales bacterium]
MRILQVCNKPPYPPRDGGSLAMFSLARALHALGHKITVLTMFTDKHKLTREHHLEYTKIMEVHTIYVDAGLKLKGLLFNLLFSDKPYTASRFYSLQFERELVKLLKSNEIDIIQLEGLYLTPYIKLIRNNSDALIALRAHNVEHEIWTRIAAEEKGFYRKLYFTLLAKRLRRFEEEALNSYDLLIPITERDNEKFRIMGNKKPSHVCPAGVDIKNTDPGNNEVPQERYSPFTLFYLGSLDWIPNQEGLLWFVSKVFPGLRQKFPDLKLHIAGRNAPQSLIRQLDVHGVVFHGEINDPDEFSREHTVMIAPCFSGSGMRLKIIEAMALGKPVVTTSIGAEGLIAVNMEHIMIANEPEPFSECIERLIKYPDLCHQMGRNAYRIVYGRYNNNDIAIALAEFYKQQLK